MAMPTSKNNVTVRKLVSVISGLWSKRGSANGVGSLDSNGLQPYAQTYKGYYNSSDSSAKTIKIGRFKTGGDTRDPGGVSFSIVYRGNTNKSGQMLVWLSTHDVNTSTKAYKTVLFNRGAGIDDSTIKIYTDSVTESSVNYVDLYITFLAWRSVRIVPLWGNPDAWTPIFTTASIPSTAVEVSNSIFIKSAGATGTASAPVYIDESGMAQACTSLTPIPLSCSAASATKGYKIATVENSGGGDPMYAGCMIAVCVRDNGGADCQIILSVSFSEYSGSANVGPVSGKAFTLHNRLTTIGAIRFFVNRVSESKYDIYAYTNGTNNYLSCQCISGKGVTIHSSPSAETITIGNMTELARSRAVVAQDNGQIGSDTQAVYMDANGVLKPCQSGLSLNFEAVNSIPANPIVGKLYAL